MCQASAELVWVHPDSEPLDPSEFARYFERSRKDFLPEDIHEEKHLLYLFFVHDYLPLVRLQHGDIFEDEVSGYLGDVFHVLLDTLTC